MTQNLFETQYDVTKKSRLKKFYEKNKILIFSSITILIIFLGSYSFYLENKENKKIALSEKYIQAKVYLEQENKDEALKTLKELIFADDPTYSTLSFFLLMNQNLVSDNKEMSVLFNRVISNNQFSREMKNLLVYKKALFSSNFVEESELLESIRPLLNDETVWKPHALILLGDYFASKGENIKAIEFYQQILSMSNLHQNLYDKAKGKLELMANE